MDVNNDDTDNIKARVAPTSYAIAHGAKTNDSKQTAYGDTAGWWWLRSPGYDQDVAADVDSGGSLNYGSVSNAHGCVRPAFWLNLESDIF